MPQVRSHLALLLAVVACGGGGKKTTPDASQTVDAAPDARTCTGLTVASGSTDILGFDATNKIIVFGGPGGDAGDGNPLKLQFEFYGGIEPSLAGTFDLSQGNQTNYMTCAVCVRAFSVDAQGNPIKQFFQTGGSVTLTEDPLTNEHLVASFSNIQLQEVTIDGQTFASTPVAGGLCTSYGSFNVDHDKVPNAWTCQHAAYQDGTTCDCMCGGTSGIMDPDCAVANATVNGCTSGQVCYKDGCVTPPANDTCGTAVALTLGTPVTGTTIGATNNYSDGLQGTTCTGFMQQGADVTYSIALAANQAITVTLSGLDATYDGSVALLGPGAATICDAAPIATCVAGADANPEGATETFTYTAATAGTYYILVDSFYAAEAGAFTLTVN